MNLTLIKDDLERDVQQWPPLSELVPDAELFRQTAKATAKILIVDDEPDVLFTLAMRLRSVGYEVISASDGLSATKLALTENPDVIVLDIGMPGEDGHEVAQRVKSQIVTRSIPIIYLTARTAIQDKCKAYEYGAYAFVTKPYKSEELLSLIRSALK